MQHAQKQLKAVGEQFQIQGTWLDARPYGTGHINDTYAARWEHNGRVVPYIQQRINHTIFKNPPQLMDNIVRVTRHLRSKLPPQPAHELVRETLTVVPTKDGANYFQDDQGLYWRMYVFIANAQTFDICQGAVQAYEAAKAFGRFQAQLGDLPGGRLHETIPFFHHTPRRLQELEVAIQKDAFNRCAMARNDIEFCLARRPMTATITTLIEQGRMPERTTHNDTKINNVMIDDATGKGICIIDLDTVMTGCALYDFGDLVRTATRATDEDERDLSKVNMNIAVFEALVKGYLESTRSFLTPIEIEHLTLAGRLITFNIGIRFLLDYLSGDVYFKTHRPEQNLDRARLQFKMISSMEAQADAMRAVVEKYS